MAEYDFFEITGLSFDPPEKNGKKVKAAIEKAEKGLGGMLGSVSQQTQRDEINNKLALLGKLKAEVLAEDGKITPCFEKLSAEKMKAVKKRLDAAVRLEKVSKKELVVTNGKIKVQKKNTRLSKESIEEVYRLHGFTIVDIDPLAAMPKFPVNAEKIFAELELLRGSRDPNPNGADFTSVYDLYGFAAYLKGEPENASEYRDMSTQEIASIFDEYAKKNAMRNDPLGKLCVSISTAGKMNVFNNETNRKAYEQFLLYKSPELTELFSIMKDSVDSDLHDAGFADECIRQITKVFSDSDVALAIYNNEAELRDDPYIPEKASFSVKCEYCQNISEFTCFDDAKKSNCCKHCGKELYKKCSHCGREILSSANRCPECGFVFANARLFTKYIALAEVAIKQGKFADARACLIKAKNSDPNEQEHIVALEKKLDMEEGKIAEPLKKLKILTNVREYEAAENYLGEIARRYPDIDLSEQRKEISTVLSSCRSKFASCKNMAVAAKIAACLEILDLCRDFRQAKEMINASPPAKIAKADAVFDDEKKSVILSWSKVDEPGVSYCVVRKDGNEPAITIKEGKLISNDIVAASVNDSNVVSGKQYTYTIFGRRMEAFSVPCAVTVKTLSHVTDIHYWQKGENLVVSWKLPENCSGSTVSCLTNGKETVLSENAHGSIEIKNVKFGTLYIIYISANYGILGKSPKEHISVTPTPIVESFQIFSGPYKDGACSIGWSIEEKGIDIQISVNGKVVQNTRSETKSCNLILLPNDSYKVNVKAFSGGHWVSAINELEVNTYESVVIDNELSTITEKVSLNTREAANQIEIKIRLNGNVPKNISAFYCVVRTKKPGAARAPWATESDLSGEVDRVDYQTFLQWREITKQMAAHEEEAYYVTLFAVYKADGKEMFSAPCRKKFNRPLNMNVFWKADKSFLGTKMQIEIEANRPMFKRPEIVLCASPGGKLLLSENDSSAEELLRVPEECYEIPQKKIEESFVISHSTKKNEKVFLFVAEGGDGVSCSVRWMLGFNGKL